MNHILEISFLVAQGIIVIYILNIRITLPDIIRIVIRVFRGVAIGAIEQLIPFNNIAVFGIAVIIVTLKRVEVISRWVVAGILVRIGGFAIF